MVPTELKQACLLLVWVVTHSSVTCFQCLDMKSVRTLRSRNQEQIVGLTVVINPIDVEDTHFCNCLPRLNWSLLDG